jgi:hypothetical protein
MTSRQSRDRGSQGFLAKATDRAINETIRRKLETDGWTVSIKTYGHPNRPACAVTLTPASDHASVESSRSHNAWQIKRSS